jgi:hypothetical protein
MAEIHPSYLPGLKIDQHEAVRHRLVGSPKFRRGLRELGAREGAKCAAMIEQRRALVDGRADHVADEQRMVATIERGVLGATNQSGGAF